MAVIVRHTFQTPLPNDPAKNVSANRWNEDHDVTGLGGMSIMDDAASDGNGYVRKNGLWARPANTDITGLGGLATKDDAASDGFFYGRRNAAWVKGLVADTAANLASGNPTLLAGQIGFETDTKYFKIGDGATAYNSLMYQLQRTLETAYTPTFTGFGTVSAVNFTQARVGNRLKGMGKATSGTPTAVEARISLPNSLISDAALVTSITVCGIWGQSVSGITGGYYCLIEPGVGYITISAQAAASSILTKQNGNAIIGAGNVMTVQFELPASGWNV